MKYSEITELKPNAKVRQYDKYLKNQQQSIELHSLENGQIFFPIFVWAEKNEIVYGQTLLEIAKKNPDLDVTVVRIPFKDWQEAEAWVIDHILSQPSVSLWDKLELACSCEQYWFLKAEAKKAQGTRTDLHSESEAKFDSKEVNKIIAVKVGCSPTMVHYFKKIRESGKKDLIEKCSSGEMQISTAYDKHFKSQGETKKSDTPTVEKAEIIPSNFFEDYGDIHLTKCMSKETAPDPSPVIERLAKSNVPEGKIWISLNKKTGTIQLFRKMVNTEKGVATIKVDSFACKVKEANNDTLIMEASYLNFGTTPFNRKDDSDFENVA